MDLYELIKSQKNGMYIKFDDHEYNLKINSKRQIVVKAKHDDEHYLSMQLDKFDPPSSAKDSAALLQRVRAWKKCHQPHTTGQGERWWCTQDHKSCPVCEFQRMLHECEKHTDAADECSLCGTIMAMAYTGNNKKNIMPDCEHSVCQSCMDSMVDTTAYAVPELDGYKLNCPFCRTENIIKY